MSKDITIRGAKEHNLKNINVKIPRDKFVVITGLSGSGKSSLAFDTVYAEGQRRYVESLSAYARQFLQLMRKPNVESIEGLSPAISIEQKSTSKNPRSTVGTVTEIYDYLRLLFARIGVPYSPVTGMPIESQTITQMVDVILKMKVDSRLLILAPIIQGRKGEYRKVFADMMKRGFTRAKVDGEVYEIENIPDLEKNKKHDIEIVVDRIIMTKDLGNRLADSLETTLSLTDGIAIIENISDNSRSIFSSKFACPVSGFSISEIEPRLFSFNNPFGACSACDGLGFRMYFNPELIVPNHSLSIQDGAIISWSKTSSPYYIQTLQSIVDHYSSDMKIPWKDLTEELRNVIMSGSGDEEIQFRYNNGDRDYVITKAFEGILSNLNRRWSESDNTRIREELAKYQSTADCEACSGQRLRPEALAVKINKNHISQITQMDIQRASVWFKDLSKDLNKKQNVIAQHILKEINERLKFLVDVGLGYLDLARSAGTLSGGESQRIRLASQIGSGLTGVLYVLDEPSIGLHQRDNSQLLTTLKNLRDLGNSVIVVEHDEEAILAADHVIDMGPAAGTHGGEVIAEGSPDSITKNKLSLTGKYLKGIEQIPIPITRRTGKKSHEINIIGATENNLKKLNIQIPLGIFTCVTGVSGSGKSTLIIDTLYKAASQYLNGSRVSAGKHTSINGLHLIDKIVDINQSPIGRTPRSNPATYTGAFGPIREWFAGLPEAQIRGYKPGRFSFNVKGGRCEACQGDGLIKIEMHFLPDVYIECDECKGSRYNRETLEILYKGNSIAEVLNQTVDNAAIFFKAVPSIRNKLETLQRVGLGYIKVGQQATTLSGGEAQRVKLAKELSRRATGKTLYILDEPTTGLHFHDIRKLIEVLQDLVDKGNTIVVIEHNLEVIKTADWVIDLGPYGGDGGGKVIATGSPEKIALETKSFTGQYLAKFLHSKVTKTDTKH